MSIKELTTRLEKEILQLYNDLKNVKRHNSKIKLRTAISVMLHILNIITDKDNPNFTFLTTDIINNIYKEINNDN